MSRRINTEFDKLNGFFDQYTLKRCNSYEKQISECKILHKKLYGLMIFIAEYQVQQEKNVFLKFLEEMSSDLLLSLFAWVQGMYKPSKLELRCAIEDFLKAILSAEDVSTANEKFMFEVFDIAKDNEYFKTSLGKNCLQVLKSNYSTLCETVHSNLFQKDTTSALIFLPQYDEVKSKKIVSLYISIVENCLGVLYLNHSNIIDKMHPDNNQDFLDCLSRSTKGEVNKTLCN